MKKKSNGDSDELAVPLLTKARLRKGVMGKYYDKAMEGSNVVRIAPDLTQSFPNEVAVNRALRELLALRDVLTNIMEPVTLKRRRKSA